MDFEFTADEEALRDVVRRLLSDRAPLRTVRLRLDGRDPTWDALAAAGVTGLLAPAEVGGSGAGMTAMGVVLEEAGRVALPGALLASAVGATTAVALASPRDPLLARLAAGEAVGTVALFDGGARWSWRTTATTADPDGSLTGTKAFVPDAQEADVLVVSACDAGGLALHAVARDAPGVAIEAIATPDVTRRFATVRLDRAPARRIGAGDASSVIATTVDRLAIAYAVDGVGAASAALELAVEHAKARVQFGRPIGSFQAVQHLCAGMLRSVELARAGAYHALWAADHAEADARHRAATMAQAFVSDALPRVGADAVQVLGGIGYTWDHDVHFLLKRLLTLEHVLGGAGEHLEELARLVV